MGAEELSVLGNAGPHITTVAVADDQTENTREVEHHQVVEVRRFSTHVSSAMAKLDDKAECGEGGPFKEGPVPLLKYVLV